VGAALAAIIAAKAAPTDTDTRQTTLLIAPIVHHRFDKPDTFFFVLSGCFWYILIVFIATF